jgi:tRNA 2-thiouridine synthesizing protein A
MSLFDTQANYHMDTSGLDCPEPVMLLHSKIKEMVVGDLLAVVATDPSTQRDIPNFCRFLGHELVDNAEQDSRFYYLIRKGE